MMTNRYFSNRRTERGTALVISLVFLVLLTMIAITSVTTTGLEQKMAGNLKDQHLAFQAAEAALRDAESRIATHTISGFSAACTNGLCTEAAGNSTPNWLSVSWSPASSTTTQYGTDTGVAALDGVAEQPRYIIENVPAPLAGATAAWAASGSLGTGFGVPPPPVSSTRYYRVTARGVGGNAAARTMVQSVFAK